MTVYLDHAATTPLRPSAFEAMVPWLTERFGNPSGAHAFARQARAALEDARDDVADALGSLPGEVVFTGGGTESDNLALMGAVASHAGTVLCSAVEHPAVLRTVTHLGGQLIPVDENGVVDLEQLESMLDDRVRVVSVMLVNNEVGTVQPLHKVARLIERRAPHVLLHTDAIQALPWIDVAGYATKASLVSVSAHKIGGPQGVGALVVRDKVKIGPLLHGGGQERERRSGTHNVAGIVGFAAALRATVEQRNAEGARVTALRDRLVDALCRQIPGVVETVPREMRVAGNAHVCVEGVENEALLILLDEAGIGASGGSSCSSGALEPSHVLLAMGRDEATARRGIRFSLGHTTTDHDIDTVVKVMPELVERLRGDR